MRAITTISVPDLTGKVRKAHENYPFQHGSDADIWKGEYRKDSRTAPIPVAIKVVRCIFSADDAKRLNDKLVREGRVWSLLHHPNISPFFGVSYDLALHNQPCLISPYYENGNSTTYLKKNTGADRVSLLCQVAAGLAYLHNQKPPIVHGDMKGSNVLINENGRACITDFGLSRILETSGFTTKNLGGTTRYMAIELMPTNVGAHLNSSVSSITPRLTMATDIWAFGMTALEILTGIIPFADKRSDADVVRHVIRGGLPNQRVQGMDNMTNYWDVLRPCWDQVPDNRTSMRRMGRILSSQRVRKSSTKVSPCCMQ
ncbi:kinase-like protein [Leucogyrophana mollusca]|uniref:Kinase-like protein n=1 Tax=Leucogyrophana mollusca TaxID=85980 RepID=A0ACB8BV13_9AGAM|nr:kinase-like protein [Leucogyrophana mollusca]